MKQTLIESWNAFKAEKAIVLCPTSMDSSYTQATRWLERCPVEDVTKGRAVVSWVLSQQPQPASIRVAQLVKAFYRWAAQPDVAIVGTNPVASFPLPKRPQKGEDTRVIPKEEIPFVLFQMSKHRRTKNRWELWAEWMLQTGMRTGEVRALRWSDLREGRVFVHSNWTTTRGLKNTTKTNRSRTVPLNAKAMEVLAKLGTDHAPDDYIFPWNRRSFEMCFCNTMGRLVDKSLISAPYRPYDLRHTALSLWLEAGIPVAQVASWAGNSTQTVFQHYCAVVSKYEMPVN